MSNVNNYNFAKELDQFKLRILDPQIKRVDDAQKIMDDPLHQWEVGQFALAETKLKNFKDWLKFYKEFHEQGMVLVHQHEQLVNTMSKVYDKWYSDISNDGKQETEMMSMQADMLVEIFGEIFKELLPLNLPGMKPPQGLNIK
ncbi:MAG: hypothetical protein JJE45_00435 [Prolixibacteraceae bacterium]|nr:hypothetical protein [Prolixibacteraceae bacterium]